MHTWSVQILPNHPQNATHGYYVVIKKNGREVAHHVNHPVTGKVCLSYHECLEIAAMYGPSKPRPKN